MELHHIHSRLLRRWTQEIKCLAGRCGWRELLDYDLLDLIQPTVSGLNLREKGKSD
jgi:hypothetical protein